MTHVKVIQLWRYPVKSMAGERVTATAVHATGFEGDRRWGVVDLATGRVLTARRDKRLLFASAQLIAPDHVEIRLPDGSLADDAALSRWLDREGSRNSMPGSSVSEHSPQAVMNCHERTGLASGNPWTEPSPGDLVAASRENRWPPPGRSHDRPRGDPDGP